MSLTVSEIIIAVRSTACISAVDPDLSTASTSALASKSLRTCEYENGVGVRARVNLVVKVWDKFAS